MPESTKNILARERDEITRCFRCGLCRSVCPSFEQTGLESASPRGRIQFARAALEESISFDRIFQERIFDCLNCLRCVEICPSRIRTDRIVMAARGELARRGKLGLVQRALFDGVLRHPVMMRLAALAAKTSQASLLEKDGFLEAFMTRSAGFGDKLLPRFAMRPAVKRLPAVSQALNGEKKMRVGYFIGCATNYLYPRIAEAAVRVLIRNRVEVLIPRGQVCCGIPVYTSGDFSAARKLVERNRKVFASYNLDCIVTDCSSCSAALKTEIHEILGVKPFDVPVYDLTEFLVRISPLDRDLGGVERVVTYHDPCHLRRGQSIYKEPRELISMIPGISLVEMDGADRCCGGAGTFSFTHHDVSRKVGLIKAENVRATGADTLATPCPSCRIQFEDLFRHLGMDTTVVHPLELLETAYMKQDSIESDFIVIDS